MIIHMIASSIEFNREMQTCRLLLFCISHNLGNCTTAFQLFAFENQALLINLESMFFLNLCFDVVDGLRSLELQPKRVFALELDPTAINLVLFII